MKETIAKYRGKATGGEERYAHIEEVSCPITHTFSYVELEVQAEMTKVLQKIATEEKWLDDQTARQAERAKSDTPIVASAEILKRREELS